MATKHDVIVKLLRCQKECVLIKKIKNCETIYLYQVLCHQQIFNNFFVNNVEEISSRILTGKTSYSTYDNDSVKDVGQTFLFEILKFEEVYHANYNLSKNERLDVYGINAPMLKLASGQI